MSAAPHRLSCPVIVWEHPQLLDKETREALAGEVEAVVEKTTASSEALLVRIAGLLP